MAVIVPDPIVLNDISLVIGTDNYEFSVSRVELVPTTPTLQWRGMTPTATYNRSGAPTWVANIDYPQDHAAATSLSEYLRTNVGTIKQIVFKPKKPASGTAPTYTVSVLILPGPIGGAVDSIGVGSVALPCEGQPVRTVA